MPIRQPILLRLLLAPVIYAIAVLDLKLVR
jgi:hypothetical protein